MNMKGRNFGALPIVPSIEGQIKEEDLEVDATQSNAKANNSGIGASSRGGPERNEI